MNKDIKEKSPAEGEFFVYILRTQNNKLYIGQTNNLTRREFEHKNNHHGAKFIEDSKSGFFEIVYTEKYLDRIKAMKREKQLKGWTRAKKEALIIGDLNLLKRL